MAWLFGLTRSHDSTRFIFLSFLHSAKKKKHVPTKHSDGTGRGRRASAISFQPKRRELPTDFEAPVGFENCAFGPLNWAKMLFYYYCDDDDWITTKTSASIRNGHDDRRRTEGREYNGRPTWRSLACC